MEAFSHTKLISWYKITSFRYANQLSVDDEVLVHSNNNVVPAKVMNLSNLMMQGNYY